MLSKAASHDAQNLTEIMIDALDDDITNLPCIHTPCPTTHQSLDSGNAEHVMRKPKLQTKATTQICSTPSPDCRRLDFVFGRFFWATWSDVGRPYGDIWARIVQNRIEKLVQASAKDSFKKLDNRGRRLTNTPKMAVWVDRRDGRSTWNVSLEGRLVC